MLPNSFNKKKEGWRVGEKEASLNSCKSEYLKAADLECLYGSCLLKQREALWGAQSPCLLSLLSVAVQTQAVTVMDFEAWRLDLGNFIKPSCFISVVLPAVWCESGYHGVWSAGGDESRQESYIWCGRLCCGFSLSGLNSSLVKEEGSGERSRLFI